MKNKLLLVFIICFTISACTTTKYVEKEIPVETIKKEYVVDVKHDSIYVKDSIFIKSVNDTILIEKWHTKYNSIVKVDTCIVRDTIPKILASTTFKEIYTNKIYWYQYVLMYLGVIFILYLMVKQVNKIMK